MWTIKVIRSSLKISEELVQLAKRLPHDITSGITLHELNQDYHAVDEDLLEAVVILGRRVIIEDPTVVA